jgi:hypothetical protein
MGYLVAAIAALFLFSRSGGLTSLTGQSGQINTPPRGYIVPPALNTTTSQEFGVASSAAQTALSYAQGALQTAGSSLAGAIPIVGSAINTLIGFFAAQSAKRASEARDENSAVAQAVPGWDQAVTYIVNAYNAGQISSSGVGQALDAIWQQYWSEVGPVIQPGRNACQSGAVTQQTGVSFCGGAYGAACCVGYDSLKNSNVNMKYAVQQADNSGKPTPASILPVFASKYGGINRPGYTVTFIRP